MICDVFAISSEAVHSGTLRLSLYPCIDWRGESDDPIYFSHTSMDFFAVNIFFTLSDRGVSSSMMIMAPLVARIDLVISVLRVRTHSPTWMSDIRFDPIFS